MFQTPFEDISRKVSSVFEINQRVFKQALRVFQADLKGVSMVFQEYLKEFQGGFTGVSIKFQGCFESVSGKFGGS